MKNRDPLVIVVDDDVSIRNSLARLLHSADMSCQGFNSAKEMIDANVLDMAACLIVDVQMPGMRGLELQAICAKQKPALPIIMMSAFNDDDAEALALTAGAIAFLQKPFDAAALIALLHHTVGVSH